MSEKPNASVRIFSVNTRFQELAQRPGGVPREVAIEQAQSQIELFKAEYVDFVERELQELSEAFARIASDSISEDQLDDICRRCSQLRDTGTTMGFELVTFVADNLCQVLEIEMGIHLGRGDAGVPEHFLDGAQIARRLQ